jgi:type II secretory pathway predicted ATPase ExeA
MYENYWGLKEKPFENTPDPRFLYYSQQHREALARLLYVVREHKGAALLTGEFGSGKTLLSRVLWHELQQEHKYKSVFILNPRLSAIEFIQETVHQLSSGEVNPPASKIELFHSLHKILYANFNLGRHSVIIVDEAQAIENREIFEELRLLLNFQLDNTFLLTIILLGQPELKTKVINLPQLNQRMSVRFHIKGLNAKETKEYILHRLEVAGVKKPIFEEKSFEQIFYSSIGIPRIINNICDLSLLVGCGNNLETIDKDTIVKVCEDLGGSSTDAETFRSASAFVPEENSQDVEEPKKTKPKRK